MFKFLVFVTLFALLHAAPIEEEERKVTTTIGPHHVVDIIESANEHQADGSYNFSYRGDDGTSRQETAVVVNPGEKDEYLEINGSYSFIDTDGQEVLVNYKADKNGFVPVGSNIPEEISRAAEFGAQLPKVENSVVV